MKIEAAVLRSPDSPYRMETVELAEPGVGEIRVRVAGTGLCHTDLLLRAGARLARPPIILGHEGAGVVEALGAGVAGCSPATMWWSRSTRAAAVPTAWRRTRRTATPSCRATCPAWVWTGPARSGTAAANRSRLAGSGSPRSPPTPSSRPATS
jgi:Alcohol dehydrogenase GroES-like domain